MEKIEPTHKSAEATAPLHKENGMLVEVTDSPLYFAGNYFIF